MYVAFNAARCPGILLAYEDLEAIALTTVPREMSKYAAYSEFQHLKVPMDYRFFNELFDEKRDESVADSTEVQEFLQSTRRRTAEKGLTGEWRFHSNIKLYDSSFAKIKDEISYFYSSRRTFEELSNSPRPLAPFRNEILVLAHVRHPYEPANEQNNKPSFSIEHSFDDYGGYWDDMTWGFGFEHGYAIILCGDDVSTETLENLYDVLKELFK